MKINSDELRQIGDGSIRSVLCTVPQNVHQPRVPGIFPTTFPRMAIIQLAKYMEKHGYKADFYDIDMLLPAEEEVYEYIKSRQPQIVGISAVVSSSYYQVKQLSRIIRKACPHTLLVLGGYMAASARVLLLKTEVDICALGNGETTWIRLLEHVGQDGPVIPVEKLRQIKGVAFINAEGEMEITGYGEPVDVCDHHQPDYEILARGLQGRTDLIDCYFGLGKDNPWFNHDRRAHDPKRKPRLGTVISIKGCVGKCTFCQRFGKGYVNYDLEAFERHVVELKERYDVGFVSIGDENFGLPKRCSLEVARILRKHDILWSVGGVRCTTFTDEDLKLLHESGCTFIKFGVESGSQAILDVMEKRFRVGNVLTALKNAQRNGIWAPLLFCIGMPGETDETITETGRFIGEFAASQGVPPTAIDITIFFAKPFPGAPLYEYGQLVGLIGTSVDEEERYLISMSDTLPTEDDYSNLSGSSLQRVVLWKSLLKYEATRTYYNLQERKSNPNYHFPTVSFPVMRITGPRRALSLISSYIISLDTVMQQSPFVARIPRFLIYGPLRLLYYLRYLTKNYLLKWLIDRVKGLRKSKAKPSSIWFPSLPIIIGYPWRTRPATIPKGVSLRKINKELKSRRPPPTTLTEISQRILYGD